MQADKTEMNIEAIMLGERSHPPRMAHVIIPFI